MGFNWRNTKQKRNVDAWQQIYRMSEEIYSKYKEGIKIKIAILEGEMEKNEYKESNEKGEEISIKKSIIIQKIRKK